MALAKRCILFLLLVLLHNLAFSQKSCINGGFDFLGVKSSGPFGGGFHLGYEFASPKINFLALEMRIGAGLLANDGIYKTTPIEEWYYKVNYFRAGICPRLYWRMADDIDLFLDPEIGVTRLSGKTYFSELDKWNPTKTYDSNYYAIRVGAAAPISEKLKVSLAFGYSSLDFTRQLNSRPSTISYRFKDQPVNFDTSFSFMVIL